MYRLWELPTYRIAETSLPLVRFNRLRLVLLRAGESQLLDLHGLRSLGLLLEDGAWICIDRSMNDLPVFAWTRFRRPASLVADAHVACELHHYHSHASLIVDSVLEKAESDALKRLRRSRQAGRAAVLPFFKTGG